MDSILGTFRDLKKINIGADDDWADRVNRQYSSGLMFIFAVLVSIHIRDGSLSMDRGGDFDFEIDF